ncbi:MAG: TipAS antibiotic-recognition domain-containing protein, partial [Clostridia bacterium]|nr:TipAS antibiotic-recognition domain-containing protein [Clostridia bacterium]
MNERGDEIMRTFSTLVGGDCGSPEAMALVEAWKQNLNDNYYPCDNTTLACLRQMYLDEAFVQNI